MTKKADAIVENAVSLNAFYKMNNQTVPITLYAEDYEYLLSQQRISGDRLNDFEIVKGPRRKPVKL